MNGIYKSEMVENLLAYIDSFYSVIEINRNGCQPNHFFELDSFAFHETFGKIF